MKNINAKQIVMVIGIATLSVLSLSAQAGNRDHESRHSDRNSYSNDRHNGRHAGQHRNQRSHSRHNQHRRIKHHNNYNSYNRHGYGYGYGYNQHRQEHHARRYQQDHRLHLIPRISGQLHLPGIRLNLHL